MKQRIKSEMWVIRKQKNPIKTAKRKKNPKNEDTVRSPSNNFKCTNICIDHGGARRRRDRARNWKSIFKNNEKKLPYLPNLVKEIDI